jgi:hypothetical protein
MELKLNNLWYYNPWFTLTYYSCRNPILKECEDDTHTPEMGTWVSQPHFEGMGG